MGPEPPVQEPPKERKRGSLIRLVSGWVLVVVGFILSIPLVPGPGLVLLFAGIALLSGESRFIRNLIRRHREKRVIRRVLREAERVGLRINLDADLDGVEEDRETPPRATDNRR